MQRRLAHILILASVVFATTSVRAINWPMDPIDQAQPLGNSYGEYQNYGGAPYLHPGIDILRPAGTLVRAVKAGYVKAILTTSGDQHWRVAIGDAFDATPCDGWLYAHLDRYSITVSVGDFVNEGQYIGELVYWPVADFHHLHFVKIHNGGQPWMSDWDFIGNPLDELSVTTDLDPPVFQDVYPGQAFAYFDADGHFYLPFGSVLSGPVDVIANAYDKVGHPTWRLAPYAITYEVFNDTFSTGPINSVTFTGELYWTQNVTVIYNDDGVYNTDGDYDNRNYYFVVTNTDGDSIVETTDAASAWHTEDFNNGDWWVKVSAYDRGGNVTAESTLVTTANYFAITGRAVPCDGDPDSSGAIVTILDAGGLPQDTCGLSGQFDLDSLTLGSQHLHIERPGYADFDSTIQIPIFGEFNVALRPAYLVGDLNADQVRDALDLNRLIDILFFNSPDPPLPFWSADLNFDRVFDALDLNLLIDHLFFNAPDPGAPVCYP